MRRHQRPRNVDFWGPLCFFVLLLAPAVVRILERGLPWSDGKSTAANLAVLEAASTAMELARLKDSLRQLRDELAAATGLRYDVEGGARDRLVAGRYRAFTARVLPFEDPSPGRATMWLWVTPDASGSDGPVADGVVVSAGALVGRLRKVPLTDRIVQVETLLDPGFRVKFRCGDTVGILRGTGHRRQGPDRQANGRDLPLLEAHHLTPQGSLPAGALVVTAGDDGVYPRGVVVGTIVDDESEVSGAHPLVCAALSPSELKDAVVIVDTAGEEWRRPIDGL